MEEVDTLTIKHTPEYFQRIPIYALNHRARLELSLHLNPQTTSGNDWRAVAEEIGCRPIEIENIELKEDPFRAVFKHATQKSITLHDFVEILKSINRVDVINDCGVLIDHDAQKYKPVQVAEVSSSRVPLTFGELETGEPEYFDAFVSYHPQDYTRFLCVLIEKIEVEGGYKLCIPDRDLMIGINQGQALAEIVEKRCKRTIIVLSEDYINSEDDILQWQMYFAHALEPAAQRVNKIIPIKIDKNITVPGILRPFVISDYTNEAQRIWFWGKVIRSLANPTGEAGGYRGPEKIGNK